MTGSTFKAQRIAAILITACAICIFSAASASASWFVGGTELKTSAALATAEVVDEVAKMLVPDLENFIIACSGGTLDGTNPEIIAGDSVKAAALKFLDCNTNKTSCRLSETNQTVITTPITARISLSEGDSDRIVYLAQTKNIIAEILFSEANTCAFAGVQPVKGSVVDIVPGGQLEGESELLEGLGSFENNSLEIGKGNKMFIIGGKALAKLASHSKWSFK